LGQETKREWNCWGESKGRMVVKTGDSGGKKCIPGTTKEKEKQTHVEGKKDLGGGIERGKGRGTAVAMIQVDYSDSLEKGRIVAAKRGESKGGHPLNGKTKIACLNDYEKTAIANRARISF